MQSRCERGGRAGSRSGTNEDLDIGSDLSSAGKARALVSAMLLGAGWSPDAIDAACTLVSEVVTNAVLHGGSLAGARIDLSAERLRFSVADSSTQLPRLGEPDLWATSGRGVQLVGELADRWGVEVDPDDVGAKRVWFEMRRIARLPLDAPESR